MASQQPPPNHAIDPRLGAATPPPPTSNPSPHQQQHQQHQQLQFEHHPSAHANIAPYGQPSPHAYYPNYPPLQAHTPVSAPPASTGSPSNQASPALGAYQHHQTPRGEGELSADDGNNDGGTEDIKRPRACEACRGLKVRCDQDPQRPDIPCRRCQKANRPCVITAPSRKRQKKADNRVAELERKLDVLTAVLQQQQQHVMPSPHQQPLYQHSQQYGDMQQSSTTDIEAGPSMQPPQKRRRAEEDEADTCFPSISAPSEDLNTNILQTSPKPPYVTSHMPPRSQEHLLDRIHQLVSPDVGVKLFVRYVTKLSPHMPAVVFPPDTTAEQIRNERPILYVCILTAASAGILHPDICANLARESIRTIADCVVCNGAKSLELIQAMQVTALWYKPPEKAEQTNFYQIIHMAAVMAIDIGLGKRFNGAKAKRGFGGPNAEFAPGPQMMLPQNSDTLEARRAWLGCYYMCASASMVLRRPNLVHWSNYMKECVDILETCPEASPSDKMFCQHIKIQHICEEIGVQFLMDDNTATVSITDPKVTYTLNVLENDLKSWKDNIPTEYKSDPSLIFFEHVASLYLHEIALHFNHNVEDFRLPFTEESLKTVNNSSETLTHQQVSALIACRTAAHGILDTMLSFDLETIKSLPMLIFFVRCTYSVVILIKMHVSITTPGSEISKILTTESLRVEHYLDGLIGVFSRVHGESQELIHPHPKILKILRVLREWFERFKSGQEGETQREESFGGSSKQGLWMLSQAAAAGEDSGRQEQRNQQQRPSQHKGSATPQQPQNWAVGGYPYPIEGTSSAPGQQQQQQFSLQQQQNLGAYAPNVDGSSSGWLGDIPYGIDWGSGFQQAMDLNLGAMEGLNGGGIDGLFMGDGMLPFGSGGGGGSGGGFGGEGFQ